MNEENSKTYKATETFECKFCGYIYDIEDCDKDINFPYCPQCGGEPKGTRTLSTLQTSRIMKESTVNIERESNAEIKQKSWFQQLFCKHEFVQAKISSKFVSISGERIYTVCENCGKIKKSHYRAFEGIGYK